MVEADRRWVDSLAWNETEQGWAIDTENWVLDESYASALGPGGALHGNMTIGPGAQSSVGNWDVADRRLVAWSGDNGSGTIKVLDPYEGAVTDLGAGTFPVFTPLFRVAVSCFHGEVEVRDLESSAVVPCGPGQTVVADDTVEQGDIQSAAPLPAPYLLDVTPAQGAVVVNDQNPRVQFRFSEEIDPDTVADRPFTAVSWPCSDLPGDAGFEQNWTRHAELLDDGTNPNVLNATVADLVAAGRMTVGWNAGQTEMTVTIADAQFARDDGHLCEVSLDLSGVENAGGLSLPFNEARTRFIFADPVGSEGGEIWDGDGGRLVVPAGALGADAALSARYTGGLPDGAGLPGPGAWRQVSSTHTFTPVDQALLATVNVSVPVDYIYPGLSMWRWDGADWTPVGGTYDPGTRRLTASVGELGAYCAFYQAPASASLILTKWADKGSAVAGEEVAYSLCVVNLGQHDATGASVTDVLPDGLEYVDGSATEGGVYGDGPRRLLWTVGSLSPLDGRWLSFRATVAPSAAHGQLITNTASVGCDQHAPFVGNGQELRIGLATSDSPRFGCGGAGSQDWSELAALGATWRRVAAEIDKDEAATPSLIDFSTFDTQVLGNQAAGLQTYGIVNARPVGGEWPGSGAFASAFGLFVERYDGDGVDDLPGLTRSVRHWELFDDYGRIPRPTAWDGCSLEMYGDYLVDCHAVAHAADPHATILPSALAGSPPEGQTRYLDMMLNARPGVADSIDALSVKSGWELSFYDDGEGGSGQYQECLSMHDYFAALGLDDREVWHRSAGFTETYTWRRDNEGYVCTQEDNARFIARAIPFTLAAHYDRVIYSELDYDPGASEAQKWAAMRDSSGNRRTSFYVYWRMVETLEGFTRAELLDFGGGAVGVKFLVHDQPVWVVWHAMDQTGTVDVAVGPVASVLETDAIPLMFDNSSATWNERTTPVSAGAARIRVTGVAVYVKPGGYIDPDIDGDGIPNEEDNDTDGDGMPNDYESGNGLDPFVDDARGDLDGDGCVNVEEMQTGTDPQSASSALVCGRPGALRGEVAVEWQTVAGRTYAVQWTDDLRAGWQDAVNATLCATGSVTRWRDTGPPATGAWDPVHPRRFYSIRLLP
jgi:uncharacterized repeat protein (TIGR01451 family)